jgi:hypothetical protein
MGLKQVQNSDRIIFLKQFTQEMLINLSKNYLIKEKIEIEKLKQKFVEPHEIRKSSLHRTIIPVETIPKIIQAPPSPIIQKKTLTSTKSPLQGMKESMSLEKKENISKKIPPIFKQSNNNLQSQKIPANAFAKINPFLKDKSVQMIECSGPGKNILVKRYNKINLTKTILTQEEIKEIINRFATEARIPVINGILKAAVNNLIISAIISEFVGSRFIINKSTPYSIIE